MIGFLLWVGLLFLPGVALGEALKLWDAEEPLALKLGTAFGLGLCVNVILQVADSFFLIHGLGLSSLFPSVSLSVCLLYLAFIRKGRLAIVGKPRIKRSWFAFLFASLALMVLAYFLANPYFPDLPSVDFSAHVRNLETLSLRYPGFKESILYYGFYYVVGPLMALESASPLFLARESVGVLVVLSLFLVHRCAFDISNDERVALVADAIYVFGGFVWFVDGFNVGLWPNFYGIIASLFMVSASVKFFAKRGRGPSLIMVILAFGNLLFSHYSSLLVIPALLVFGLAHIKSDRRSSLAFSSVLLLPLVLGYATIPGILGTLSNLASSTSINPPSPTWLSWVFIDPVTRAVAAVPSDYPALSLPVPAVSYMVALMSDDLASFLLLASVPVFVYVLWKSKAKAHLSMPLVWFAACVAVSPFSSAAWRFAAVGLMPLIPIAASSIISLVPFQRVMRKSRMADLKPTNYGKMLVGVSLLLLVIPLYPSSTGSWGFINASRSARTPSVLPQDQVAIAQTLSWMKAHDSECGENVTVIIENETIIVPTPFIQWRSEPCIFVSVAEWRFSLSPLQDGPAVFYAPKDNVLWGNPEQTQLYATAHQAKFLIVTKYISEPSVPHTNVTLIADKNQVALIQKVDSYIQQLNSSVRFGTLSAFPIRFNGTFYTQQVVVLFTPWTTYTLATLPYSSVVYENVGLVRVICITTSCHDWVKMTVNA